MNYFEYTTNTTYIFIYNNSNCRDTRVMYLCVVKIRLILLFDNWSHWLESCMKFSMKFITIVFVFFSTKVN